MALVICDHISPEVDCSLVPERLDEVATHGLRQRRSLIPELAAHTAWEGAQGNRVTESAAVPARTDRTHMAAAGAAACRAAVRRAAALPLLGRGGAALRRHAACCSNSSSRSSISMQMGPSHPVPQPSRQQRQQLRQPPPPPHRQQQRRQVAAAAAKAADRTARRQQQQFVQVEPDGSDSWRLDAVVEAIKGGAVGIIPTGGWGRMKWGLCGAAGGRPAAGAQL